MHPIGSTHLLCWIAGTPLIGKQSPGSSWPEVVAAVLVLPASLPAAKLHQCCDLLPHCREHL